MANNIGLMYILCPYKIVKFKIASTCVVHVNNVYYAPKIL